MSSNSGKDVYINGYHTSVLKGHQWRTAENSCQHLLPKLREMKKVKPDIKLLDVGCGPGTITTSLAAIIPEGQVTASDISDEVLDSARAQAKETKTTNITFRAGDVYALPFEDNTFDVAHAQQLLAHLQDPVQAIREMLRVVRPGGVIALREMVIPTYCCYPPGEWFDKWLHMLIEQIKHSTAGKDSSGKYLKAWCRAAGAKEESILSSAGTWAWAAPEDRAIIGGSWAGRTVDSNYATSAIETKLATREELEEISREWVKWAENPDGYMSVLHGEALVTVE